MSHSYTVARGDTLWAIATRFYGQGHLFRIIAEANGISNPDRIFPGQVLHIPDLAPPPPPPPAPPPPAPPPPAPPPQPTDPPPPQPQPPQPPGPIDFRLLRPTDLVDLRCTAVGFRLTSADEPPDHTVRHTVVRGDTLWDIAEHYYGDPRRYPEIAAANRIPNPDRIFPGQVFVIPGLTARPSVPPPAPPPSASMTYRVVRGDSLWKIARRFYDDPRRYPQIAAANRISNPNLIFPGQLLVIPGVPGTPPPGSTSYTVQPGDTLWDIARTFYGDPRRYPEIVAANHIPNPDLIFPGQVFVIPGIAGPPDPGTPDHGTRHLLAESDTARIIVRFGPQNLFEERDVAGNGVARVLAARESRVVFAAPVGARIEFSVAGVLRALPTLPVRVSPSAKPALVESKDLDQQPVAPVDDQTSIEAPYRLVVSPSGHGAFAHDAEATTAPGDPTRVELWSTRLTVRKVTAEGVFDGHDDSDTQRIVRALHTRDDDPGTLEPPFKGSLTPPSNPDVPVPAGTWRRTIVQQTSTSSTTVAHAPLSVRKLHLTAVGAWIDWTGRWDDSTTMTLYRHLASMGRDAYVRVDEPGFLFPFGHRAVKVNVTERRIQPGQDPVARLISREFLVLRETTRTYDGQARHHLPFTEVTIGPEITPDLDLSTGITVPLTPTSDLNQKRQPFMWSITGLDHAGRGIKLTGPLVFVPEPAAHEVPEAVADEGKAKDQWHQAAVLLAALPDKPVPPEKVPAGGPTIAAAGQEVAMAPEKVTGDTRVRVEELKFDGAIVTLRRPDGTVAGHTSTPSLEWAAVSLPALTALNGGGAPVKVKYEAEYRTRGFDGGRAEVFMVLISPPTDPSNPDGEKIDSRLTFAGSSDRAGGFIQPSMAVRALSRAHGAISDNQVRPGSALSQGKFDPNSILTKGLLPKLFGLFDLTEILRSDVDLDKAPTLITEQLKLLEGLPAETQRLLGALDQTSAALATASTNAEHAGAKQSLEALRSRAQAARAELVDAHRPLLAALSDVLAGRPNDAVARAAELKTKLDRLDAVMSDPVLPAFARAALERPRNALRDVIDVADDAGQLAALQALGNSVLRYDWRPTLKSWPDEPKPVFIPPEDGLTISVEIRPANGREPTVDVSAQLVDFQLALLPQAQLMELRFSWIGFRMATGRKPEIDVVFDRMEFLGPLVFIEKLRQVIPVDGFADPPYVDISTAGATAGFDLALPSVAVGVFSLENIALAADCRVPFLGDAVTVGFGFCSKERPFRLTVMAIGGGGWVAIRLSPEGLVVLEMGLEAGASLSIDFGVASGSVSVMVGVYLRLEGDDGHLTGYFRIRGEVDVLGLASASITLELSLTYDFATGKLVGRASIRVEVEVLFFSASVEVSVERRLAGSKGDPKLIEVMPPDEGGQDMWESYFGAFAVGA